MKQRIVRLVNAPLPRGLLWFLLIVNVTGAVFGYNWYAPQLSELPPYIWIVVSDSPLSVTGVAFAVFLRLIRRPVPWLEWWSSLAAIKYGAWAALFWLASWLTGVPFTAFDFFGLFLTHIGMVLQGVLLLHHAPSLRRRSGPLILGWFFLNDYFDYVHRLHPTIFNHLFVWCAATAVCLSFVLVGLYFLYGQGDKKGAGS